MQNPLTGMLSLKRRTLRYEGSAPPMPERYRGRPGPAAVDLGECLFSPEESASESGEGFTYTQDPRMAARTRDGLRLQGEELSLAEALGSESRRLFGRSLRLRSVVAGSCSGCEVELIALNNVVFDLARFGVDFVASPRHADGIVLTGAVNRNMEAALRETYDAVSDPRLVIAVGACAISGGPFRGSPELADAARERLPVDLYLPGCPPHPLTVLDGLLRLLGRLKR